MGRKTRTKKIRTREMYLTAKTIGGAVLTKTSHGMVLLNTMKHYCYQKPYKNDEYQSIMLQNISRMAKQMKGV